MKTSTFNQFVVLWISLLCLTSFNLTAGTSCTIAMDSVKFEKLTKKIVVNDFDEAKITAIKTSLENNCFTSLQIKTLLQLLSFEEDKINIVKVAYKKILDFENFDVILEVFEFETSKKEIKDFIAGSK